MTSQGFHQFGKKVLLGMFRRIRIDRSAKDSQGFTNFADVEELEKMDTSEIHAWRLNAEEVWAPKIGEKYFPDRRWNGQIIWRR